MGHRYIALDFYLKCMKMHYYEFCSLILLRLRKFLGTQLTYTIVILRKDIEMI